MAQVLPDERELRRVIGDGEAFPDGEVDGLDERDLIELYRGMVLLRTYDERSVVYHRQGRVGTYAIFWNHEAMQAGAAHALADEDWIFPSYRESAIGLLRGLPPATVLSWWRGHPAGWWNPEEYRVASICVPIGTHVPHAAGLAWGKKLKGESACAIVFFGDGATSEGSFHEGANFAAVTGAPLVLFCNNNYWAISTPLEAQTRAETLADKAVGYGMPGLRVDGTDVLAVYEATREAVARARAGEGPTFVEALTYRTMPHATADDPSAYVDLARVEEEKQRECVARYDAYLRRLGVLDDATAEEIRAVELERDDSVLVMGEDVGRAGGVFRATVGLRDRFGPDRCVDTPLAEAGILGSAVGLCMAGWRPVCEMQYDAFSYPCLDQLIVHVGRYRWRSGGAMAFPLVVRMPYGGGVRAPELHDDSPETYDVRTLKPLDEEALLASAAKTGRVVIVQEAPRTCGYAAELAAILAEHAILDLHGPVLRVTGYDVPYPYWQIEDAYMPSVGRVVDAARKLLG